nr:putative zinc finger, RING/FYVE/PHD-type [Tanacetum cinerariifolium]
MLISKTSEDECNQEFDAIFQDYEDIQSMLFDDYKTLQMELTIDHGAVDTVRLFNEFGQELDGEHNQKVSMEIAKLALWLFIKVNAQQGDHVDEVMLISKTSEDECNQEFDAIFQDYEDIQSMLFDDYKTFQMELTIDHGAVDTVRLFNEFGQELDDEHNQKVSINIAKLALWTENQDAIDALELLLILKRSQVRCKQPLVVVYAEWEFTRFRSWVDPEPVDEVFQSRHRDDHARHARCLRRRIYGLGDDDLRSPTS